MGIDYRYRKTENIEKNIVKIEVARQVIELLPQLPHIEEHLRHKSLLKSSLFSARIEGNRLRIEEIESDNRNISRDKEKKEVLNILRALKWIHSKNSPKKINVNTILKLHRFVMDDLSPNPGQLRHEPSAIFNQGGIAVYMAPPPSEVLDLIHHLIEAIKTSKEHPGVAAALGHFAFEKIHPFLDGNGRVGRLLSLYILKNSGYGFRGLVANEEYLESHRQEYYDLLSSANIDITDFVEFFLHSIVISAEKAIEELKPKTEETDVDTLLPRRQEILAIINDHRMVSFNFLKRRFQKIPDSSLHYDLKVLRRIGFIKKLGSTRGVLYALK